MIEKKSRYSFIVFVLVAGFGAVCNGQSLRWDLKSGQKYQIDIAQTTNTAISTTVRKVLSEYELQMSLNWHIKSVEGDVITIEQSISRLAINGKRNTNEVVALDTDQDPGRLTGAQKDMHKALMALVGKQATDNPVFLVEMTTRGKITNVTIPEKTLEALRDAPASMRIRQIFTEEGYKEIFGQATLEFPEQEVSVDQSWTASDAIEFSNGKIDVSHTYTIEKITEEAAQIRVRSELAMTSTDDPQKLKMEITEQSASGVIQVDRKKGVVESTNMTTHLVTTSKYQEETITSTIDSNIKLSIKSMDTTQ
jgi:hypothetical protein